MTAGAEHDPVLRLIDASCLLVRSWDDETVVYDIRSGETHLLDGAAAAVFTWLHESPLTRSVLLDRVRAALDEEVHTPEFFLGHLLDELQRRQLLERSAVASD